MPDQVTVTERSSPIAITAEVGPPGPPSLAGTLAARPAAGAGNAGWVYFATDDAGGTVYRSNGAAWVKVAASVLQSGGAMLGSAKTTTTSQTTTTVYPSFTDLTGSAITIVHGVRPILLTFTAMQLRSNTANMVQFAAIREGSTVLGVGATSNVGTASRGMTPIVRALIDTPDTGVAHTYKTSFATGAAATAEIIADPTYPTLLMAQEV